VTRTARQGLGDAGEGHARRFLEQQGYESIAQNWRCQFGELDLIMRDGAALVFVEVKTRRGERYGAAEEAITAAKARRLLLTAQSYLAERPDLSDAAWRVDVVAITLSPSGAVDRLSHLIDAVHGDRSGLISA
jgi:putative endonuclease